MAQISTLGGLPNPVSPPTSTEKTNRATKVGAASDSAPSTVSDDATTSSYQAQLTRLSSVLSGLQLGASQIRAQALNAAKQIKAGTYRVDPLQISRSIVSDHLGTSAVAAFS